MVPPVARSRPAQLHGENGTDRVALIFYATAVRHSRRVRAPAHCRAGARTTTTETPHMYTPIAAFATLLLAHGAMLPQLRPVNPATAPKASIDRFSTRAGHLQQ